MCSWFYFFLVRSVISRGGTVDVLLKAGACTTTPPLNSAAIQGLRGSMNVPSANLLNRSRTRTRLCRRLSGASAAAVSAGMRRAMNAGGDGRAAGRRFDLPGEPAISLALTAAHLDVCLQVRKLF